MTLAVIGCVADQLMSSRVWRHVKPEGFILQKKQKMEALCSHDMMQTLERVRENSKVIKQTLACGSTMQILVLFILSLNCLKHCAG